MTKAKLKTWWKEEGETTVRAVLAVAAIAMVSGSIGYANGCYNTKQNVNASLRKCFEYNPALKDELCEAIRELSQA